MNCRQCGRRIDVELSTTSLEEKSSQRDSMVCEYCGAAHSQSFLFESTIVGLPLDERELGNEGDTTVAAPRGLKSEPEDESKKLIPKRFTGLQTVGRGSFGIVYRCRDQLLKRTVAVKVPCTELGGSMPYFPSGDVSVERDEKNYRFVSWPIQSCSRVFDGLKRNHLGRYFKDLAQD